jgi:hypothetical protein
VGGGAVIQRPASGAISGPSRVARRPRNTSEPCSISSAIDLAAAADTNDASISSVDSRSLQSTRQLRILVVDDNKDSADSAQPVSTIDWVNLLISRRFSEC